MFHQGLVPREQEFCPAQALVSVPSSGLQTRAYTCSPPPGIVDLFRLFVASQGGEEWLFNLILDQLPFSSKLEEVWFWPCSQGNLEEPDFPVHSGNCCLGSRILCFSIKVLCKPFPCSFHPVERQLSSLSPRGMGLSPEHRRRYHQGKV